MTLQPPHSPRASSGPLSFRCGLTCNIPTGTSGRQNSCPYVASGQPSAHRIIWHDLATADRRAQAHARPRHAGARRSAWRLCTARAAVEDAPALPRMDYVARMRRRELHQQTCPLLLLAPMENLADRSFRRALAFTIGGFDEACTEFMRIPPKSMNPLGSVRGVCGWYDPRELAPRAALGAQVMGSTPEYMAMAAKYLQAKGAPRVDLNCGCPANTVTGNGAGSSLLRTPELLAANVGAMVAAVDGRVPVSVKMRSGFNDTGLFTDNLLAAQEAGAAFVTLHPRTKRQCYDGRADWSLTAAARSLLRIPVVGNGDVVSAAAAQQLVRQTGCHAVMVGRGAVQDPLLFLRIRFSFERPDASLELDEPEAVQAFLRAYADHFMPAAAAADQEGLGTGQGVAAVGLDEPAEAMRGGAASRGRHGQGPLRPTGQFGRLKLIMRYLFVSSPELRHSCDALLRRTPDNCTADEMLELLCRHIAAHWPASGPSRLALIDHMNKTETELVEAATAGAAATAAAAVR